MLPIRRLISLVPLAILSNPVFCQDGASPKFVFFGGAGVTNQSAVTRTSTHFGVDFEEAPPVRDRFPFGFLFEGGYVGPAASLASGSAVFSANYMGAFDIYPSSPRKAVYLIPFFTGGYTRLFGTGNAINYGGGVDLRFGYAKALRFEVRDYLRLSGPKDHNAALRLGIVFYLRD